MTIKKRNLAFILMFFPFLLDLNLFAPINESYGSLFIRIIFFDSLLIYALNFRKLRLLSPVTKCLIGYSFLVFLFTAVNSNATWFVGMYYAVSMSAYCILIDLKFQEDSIFVLNFITRLFGFVLMITLVFQLINPTAFGVGASSNNNYNFWVSDNEMGYVYVPLVIAVACREWIIKQKFSWKTYFCVAVASISVFLAWSGACVTGTIIMLVGFIVAVFDIKWFTFRKLFIMYLVLFFGIVVFRIQDIFSFFIVDVLHKDLTLTGRVYAWDMALETIRDNLLIGYGTINGGRLTILQVWANTDPVSTHSFFLEVTLQGGIIGIVLYVLAYIFAGRKLLKNSGNRLIIFIAASIFSVLVMYITEGWIYHTFQYTLLYLAYYSEKFVELSGKFSKEHTIKNI